MAQKDGDLVAARGHSPRAQHRAIELLLSTDSDDGAACFRNFDHVGARYATLAKIRELATGLGACFDGHPVSGSERHTHGQVASLTCCASTCARRAMS